MVDAQATPVLVRPWAKHAKKHGVHALVCHLIDTMEVAYRLYPIFLGPAVRRELERTFHPLAGEARAWVALLCGLHDLGKYTPAFQSLVLEAALERFPAEDHPILKESAPGRKLGHLDTKHGLATAVHLEAMLKAAGARRETVLLTSSVLGGHHGWFPEPGVLDDVRGKRDLGGRAWREARSAMVRRLAEIAGLDFDDPGWSETEVSALGMTALAGLTTISDWVASDASFFGYRSDPEDLIAYREQAGERAERALAETNWSAWNPGERTGFTELFGETPRPLQAAVAECLEDCAEPGVLVLEAPPGEGKTKAGLHAAAFLAKRLGLGGVYLSTPTKELSRQAVGDTRTLLAATGSGLDVNLVYSGAAKEQREERKRRSIEPECVGQEKEVGDDGVQEPWEWFSRKKGLAFPVGVGTLDQAVKSVIRSGHNFLGMTALSNKVVLIDEVHSYDAYTGMLIKQLMWFSGRMGVPVVLMSATLSGGCRAELIEHWHAGAEDRAVDAERIRVVEPGSWRVTWSGGSGGSQGFELSEPTVRRGKIRVEHLDESPQAIAGRAVAEAGEQGTALVVLNTKTRAHKVRDRIRGLLEGRRHPPELIFFTGDHQGGERQKIYARIDAQLGRNSPPDRHAIVVGTQVLEHGVDIDADVLISDLCPIDFLFQRSGRLHRHARSDRPEGLRSPRMLVADLDPARRAARTSSQRESLGFTQGVPSVYSPWVLGRSRVVWNEVLAQGGWDPLEEIGKQLHRVYVDEESLVEEGWEDAWDQAEHAYRQRLEKLEFQARVVMVSRGRSASAMLRMTRRSGPAGLTRFSEWEEDSGRPREG